MEEESYTVQEAARILRTTERTVRRRLERIESVNAAPKKPKVSSQEPDTTV